MANTNDNNRNNTNQNNQTPGNRGVGSMDSEKQREVAGEGGRASHSAGTAHEFTSEEARKAGSQSHGSDKAQASSGTNRNSNSTGSNSDSTRGGSSEQHAEAGRQSHKNDDQKR